ncbi:MAG: CoA-binding protein [Actinobacteria bacterium]|nr:CoA-binding protein [Actinomycetota bacterium]
MDIGELIKRAINKENIIAVVGASNNPRKYGHRIYKDLKGAGYKLYPVNPKEDQIQGDKTYPNIGSLPEKPDVVNIVTPPQVTEKIVGEAVDQKIDIIWMQPGAESKEAIDYARENGVSVIHNACIMIERRR